MNLFLDKVDMWLFVKVSKYSNKERIDNIINYFKSGYCKTSLQIIGNIK